MQRSQSVVDPGFFRVYVALKSTHLKTTVYTVVSKKLRIFIKMRSACGPLLPFSLKKRLPEGRWLQVGSSHFSENYSLSDTTVGANRKYQAKLFSGPLVSFICGVSKSVYLHGNIKALLFDVENIWVILTN